MGQETVKKMNYAITDEEFQLFSSLVYEHSGIKLPVSKKALLVSRLSRRLRELGLKTFHAYYERVVGESGGKEFTSMLDLISTNKTDFFREPRHFEFLRSHILPDLIQTKQIRIWSAACSSGEEPYSIAMTIYDGVASPTRWNYKILASDLSTRVLAKASLGIYDTELVSNLPQEIVRRHFLKGHGNEAGKIKVRPHLSDMVVFRRINLMDERYPIKNPLDAIFCRNVMIYFDRPTQERLMVKFYRYLKPGGYLFTGHSESMLWIGYHFSYVEPTIYRKEA